MYELVKLKGSFEKEYFAIALPLDDGIGRLPLYWKLSAFDYDRLDDPEAFLSNMVKKLNS